MGAAEGSWLEGIFRLHRTTSRLSSSALDDLDRWPVEPPAGWRGLQLREGLFDGAFAAERRREVTRLKQALRKLLGWSILA